MLPSGNVDAFRNLTQCCIHPISSELSDAQDKLTFNKLFYTILGNYQYIRAVKYVRS